jgi:peptide/nickel transport system substrate-binding protein
MVLEEKMKLTRRHFLMFSGLSATALLMSCGGKSPKTPTAAPGATTSGTSGSGSIATGTSSTAQVQQGSPTPTQGGTIVFGRTDDGDGFDPGTNNNGSSFEIQANLMDTLVRFKVDSVNIEPALAEKWEFADNGLTGTLHLRDSVKFHDGTPVTADAVIFNIDRQINKDNPTYFEGQMLNGDFLYGTLDSYTATDQSTVTLKLKHPYAPLLRNFAVPSASIVSVDAIKKSGKDFANNPVGSGPFKFVEWVSSDHITVERNADYWGGAPYLDKVVFRTIPENSVRLAKLQAGESDYIEGISPDQVSSVKGDKRVVLTEVPGMGVNAVLFNVTRKPYDDVRVRQALNYAINREDMNKFLYQGLATIANSPIPPTIPGYDPSLKPYPFDPDKAKQLLSDAGHADGFEANMITYNTALAYNPAGGQKLAETIQQYLSDVKVTVKIETLEVGSWLSKRRAGDFDLACGGWYGDNGDADNFFYSLYHTDNLHTTNNCLISDPKLDKQIVDAQQEYDESKRAAIYKDIQAYLMDIVPWIYLNVPSYFAAGKPKIHDLYMNPVYLWFFHKVWVSS